MRDLFKSANIREITAFTHSKFPPGEIFNRDGMHLSEERSFLMVSSLAGILRGVGIVRRSIKQIFLGNRGLWVVFNYKQPQNSCKKALFYF